MSLSCRGVCEYYTRTKLVGPLERTPELTNKSHSFCRLKFRLVDGLGIFQLAGPVMLDHLAKRGVMKLSTYDSNTTPPIKALVPFI